MFSTPIAYIIFNRPHHTRETFAAIRAQHPARLFIIADGPRPGHPTDGERCQETREIVEDIDWPCEVQRNYSEKNLGCKQRVISGLDWVFSQVECAIILEDDCLPHSDFFGFCQEMLEHYTDDNHVMVVTGNNHMGGRRCGTAAYYFSKYNHIWGWATWRRAWQKNDSTLAFWPEWKKSNAWVEFMTDKVERQHWENIFDRMYRNEIDTWDFPWVANVWYYGGLTVTPNVNLVTNIGFGPDGTHTVCDKDQEGLPVHPIGKITHPKIVKLDQRADRYVFDNYIGGRSKRLSWRVLSLPRRIAGKFYRIIKNCIHNEP